MSVPLSRKEMCLAILERRANYLEARAAIRESNNQPYSLDIAEVAALQWAVAVIREFNNLIDDSTAPDIARIHITGRLGAAEIGK